MTAPPAPTPAAPPAPAAPGPDPATPPAPTPPPPPAADPAAPPAAPAADELWNDPGKAKAEIERLRRENGAARVNAKEQAAKEARDQLLRQLGLTPEGQPAPTPEQLAEQLASRDAELWKLRVENALPAAARAAGADEDLLKGQFAYDGSVDALDPADPEFVAKLEALAKDAVQKNPKLKAQGRAPGASGIEITGGSGEPPQITDPAVIKAMSPEQRVEALEKGQLRIYMAS